MLPQSTADVVIGSLLAAILAAYPILVRRQVTAGNRNREALAAVAEANRAELARQAEQFRAALGALAETFSTRMQAIALNLAELNTGASAGAKAAIQDLRADMRNGLRDLEREVGKLRGEHDTLAERHNVGQASAAQFAERLNSTREMTFELRRDVAQIQATIGQPHGRASS